MKVLLHLFFFIERLTNINKAEVPLDKATALSSPNFK